MRRFHRNRLLIARPLPLPCKRTVELREQHCVLQLNMLLRVFGKKSSFAVQAEPMFCRRPPARGLPRQCHQLRQPVGVFLMLDIITQMGWVTRSFRLAPASEEHAFLGHDPAIRVHLLQKHCQTRGTSG